MRMQLVGIEQYVDGVVSEVIRPAAPEFDRAQEFPWPVVEEAARQGLYGWELYAQLSTDPTGLSLPVLMEELCWGCAGIGLGIIGTGSMWATNIAYMNDSTEFEVALRLIRESLYRGVQTDEQQAKRYALTHL